MGEIIDCLSINWLFLCLKYVEVSSIYSIVDGSSSKAQVENYHQM